MAMMRPRRPTFRTQPSFRPLYQDFKPKSEMAENPEAHVLQIHLPGFTKERVRVQYDDSSQMVRVSGERPIDGGNRRSRFREAYQVPQNCIMNNILSNFRQGILTIIMPKKIISQPEVKPTQEQEEALSGPPPQKAEQAILPKSATQQETRDDEKTAFSSSTSGTGPGDMKAQEKSPSQKPIIDSQKPEKESAEKKADGVPQKFTEETEPKPTLKLDQGKVADEKPQKVQQEMDEKPQKGQEETEPKSILEMAPRSKMDEKPRKGQEETEPKPISEMVPRKPLDEKPERGQEGTNQNATTLTSVPGKQSGEKTGERKGEDADKERISDKEIVEEGKLSESRKTENGVKEITERKEFVKAGEHSVPKIPEKEKETTRKAEAAAAAAKEWNLNDGIIGPTGKGIKEVTTRIAEGKWDNEDKPLLLNMGASILVLAAVGVYALYRFSSS